MLTTVLLLAAGAVIGAVLALVAGLIVAAHDGDNWPPPSPEIKFVTWERIREEYRDGAD